MVSIKLALLIVKSPKAPPPKPPPPPNCYSRLLSSWAKAKLVPQASQGDGTSSRSGIRMLKNVAFVTLDIIRPSGRHVKPPRVVIQHNRELNNSRAMPSPPLSP